METNNEALKKQLKQEFIERLMTRFLDIAIMIRFQNEPFSNYDAHMFVQNDFGLRVSSDTVHSTIYAMERKKLVSGLNMSGKRVYRLTDKGKMTVEIATAPEEMAAFMKRLIGKTLHPKK